MAPRSESSETPADIKINSSSLSNNMDTTCKDKGEDNDNKPLLLNLEDAAGLWSRWTLGFLTPILRYGNTKALEVEDLGQIRSRMEASKSYEAVKLLWENMVMKSSTDTSIEQAPSLPRAVLHGYGKGLFYFALLCYILSAALGFVPVLILGDLVRYFETDGLSDTVLPPWIEVVLLGIIPALVGMLQTRNQVIMTHLSVFARTSISMLVFDATLTASSTARGASSTGEVINIMSNDTVQIQRFLQFVGMTLVAPVQIIVAIYLIYNQIGNATWVGVAFMICLAPMNGVVFAQVAKMRKLVLKYSDARVRLISEILGGIRVLKFNAWEPAFQKQINVYRSKELKALTRLAYIIAIGFSLVLLSAPIVQPIMVFATYVATSTEDLTAAKAFTVIALFNLMRFPFAFLPMGLVQLAQANIACNRITQYLLLPRLSKYLVYDEEKLCGDIVFKDASLVWNHKITDGHTNNEKKKGKKNGDGEKNGDVTPNADAEAGTNTANSITRPVLSSMNISIEAGSCIAVIGSVGCGKSSFLSAITGEMELTKGSITLGTSSKADNFIAYCPQTPFIVNNTLRQNIIFTSNSNVQMTSNDNASYNRTLYDAVLNACCLEDDLYQLPSADLTEIGERGINLSGGQKARVALARCMYSQAKVWLLDDPLSAVDAHVGVELMQSILNPPMYCKKTGQILQETDNIHTSSSNEYSKPTRILVTHHVHVLPQCDKVMILEDGEIVQFGTYDELLQRGVDFAGAVEFERDDDEEEDVKDVSSVPSKEVITEDQDTKQQQSTANASSADKSDVSTGKDPIKAGTKLTTSEERAKGSINFSAYMEYARIGGYSATIATILAQGCGRGFEVGSSFWLSYWASNFGDESNSNSTQYFLNIYALIAMSAVCTQLIRSLCLAHLRLRASTTLHRNLTNSVLAAPVGFFDVTPIGRVLNRFSADMDKVDLELSGSLSQAISTVFSILGAVTAITAATKGVFLVPLIPLGAVYYYLQGWFRASSTELQRVVSITASPIFVDFSETLNGITSIRAYNLQRMFFGTTIHNFNVNNVAYTSLQHANTWLGLRLDVLGGFIGAFVSGLSLATYNSSTNSAFIPAGWLGLSLTYANELSQYLKYGVRMLAQVEADMSSVERIQYYTTTIEPEAPPICDVDAKHKKEVWPQNGAIEFENVSMRYRDGPLILRDLTFQIHSGERIGVVGRTGSGKSSLMNALFRIVELAEGKIVISKQDISSIGTRMLRSNLGIIPQDPMLFSNTIRYNIDPHETASDAEIWDILKQVQLDTVVAKLSDKLEEKVAEGGENFSQGQRQLICIARALLRKPKILVMDEATASIDNTTDALIQDMIRNNFHGATVLTIAHRLNTIMDSDRIMVLDDGYLAEFDSPATLLATEGGMFKALVEKSRRSMRVSSKTDLTNV